MTSPALISVVIPVYRVEAYLDQCVESVVGQTCPHLEIILVDDGSPDRCPAMCDAWASRDPRISVVHQANGGLSAARNAGVAAAHGAYIGFVDSDDWIEPDMYARLLEGFGRGGDVVVTSCNIHQWRDGQLAEFWPTWIRRAPSEIAGADLALAMATEQASHTVWNKLYRADLVRRVPFRTGRTNEDTLFMYDLGRLMAAEGGRLVELPSYGYVYRLRSDGITQTSGTPFAISCIDNVDMMLADSKGRDARLHEALRVKQYRQMEGFLKEMLFQPEWADRYFDRYYRKYCKEFSWAFVRTHFGTRDALLMLLLRLSPRARKAVIQHLSRTHAQRHAAGQ